MQPTGMQHALTKRTLIACLLMGVASVASAQVAVNTTAEPVDLRAADAANEANNQPFCLQATGTRIHQVRQDRVHQDRVHQDRVDQDQVTAATAAPRAAACANSQPGRSWSRRDIERTGAFNLADALRQLDPSIR